MASKKDSYNSDEESLEIATESDQDLMIDDEEEYNSSSSRRSTSKKRKFPETADKQPQTEATEKPNLKLSLAKIRDAEAEVAHNPQESPHSATRRMTSRQRALYSGQQIGNDAASQAATASIEAFAYAEAAEPENGEAALIPANFARNEEKLKKRRLMRQEKLERSKLATVEKLLSKPSKSTTKKNSQGDDGTQEEQSQSSGLFYLPQDKVRLLRTRDFDVLFCHKVSDVLPTSHMPKKRATESQPRTCKICEGAGVYTHRETHAFFCSAACFKRCK